MKLSNGVLINRPVHDVFEFVADWARAPAWVAGLLETSGARLTLGATFKDVGKFLGRRMETRWEVTAFRPDREISVKTTASPVPSRVRNLFEAMDGGTQFTVETELEPGGFFKLASGFLARAATRQLQVNLENLKDLLEQERGLDR